MATYTDNCIEGKVNEDAVGLTAGERDIKLPYHPPETSSGLEEVRKS
jgi:hypothetical protein